MAEKNEKTLRPAVLLAAAECAPLSKTGGLADVVGALPKSLRALGVDARVITPYHRVIKENYAGRVRHLCSFTVRLGWRNQYVGLEQLELDGVTVYLIDNEFYFGGRIYLGGDAEGEQYAFFQRAVLEALPLLDFHPEVLHCNDWHTAMLPMLIKTQYQDQPQGRLSTLLTIHNLAYQGVFSFGFVQDLLGVDARWYTPEFMEFNGAASFLKAGCVFADRLSTVSPNYAREILSPAFGEGLEGLLSARSHELCGILNGLDTVEFDPARDPALPANFCAADPSGKAQCKRALCAQLGLDDSRDRPLIAMVSRMTRQKGFSLIGETIDAILAQDVLFVLVGTGDREFEDQMRAAERRHPGRLCAYLKYSEAMSRRVYAAADLFLMPSLFEPCGLSQMIAMRYGALPVVRETGGLADTVVPYNRFTGEGNGFSFRNFRGDELLQVLGSALTLYREDRPAFDRLRAAAMRTDCSFGRSAQAYAALYGQLCPPEPAASWPQPPCHEPADECWRVPLGAVRGGERITVRVRCGAACRTELALWPDDGGGAERMLPMEREGETFSVSFCAPETPCVLRYAFRAELRGSWGWLLPDDTGLHVRLGHERAEGFQLTVYDAAFETPEWACGAVMYQIFPDRFAPGGGAARRGLAYHQRRGRSVTLHEDWRDAVVRGAYPADFYGGTLAGIARRLPQLREMGVECIYLNPIFEANTNHRYNVGDYTRVDPILGTNREFEALCCTARELGMRIVLDGVFSHTGDDSVYFNKYGRYPGCGAAQSKDSPYAGWYPFEAFPEKYRCWWGFENMPEVDKTNGSWQEAIISGPDSVVRQWLRLGAAGWRLDVADELPDEIIGAIRTAAREEKPDALVLGEVWEDATTKVSYGHKRRYALGAGLDSVMNYPLRTALLDYLCGVTMAGDCAALLLRQRLHYPMPMYRCLMNHLGTHDTERLRTRLALGRDARALSQQEQAAPVSPERLALAAQLQRLAVLVQMTLPGMPCVYYGDEEGMQGLFDPFNRAPYVEGDASMREYYVNLMRLRRETPVLRTGAVGVYAPSDALLCLLRADETDRLLTVVNPTAETASAQLQLTEPGSGLTAAERRTLERAGLNEAVCLLTGERLPARDGTLQLSVPPYSARLYRLCVRTGSGVR